MTNTSVAISWKVSDALLLYVSLIAISVGTSLAYGRYAEVLGSHGAWVAYGAQVLLSLGAVWLWIIRRTHPLISMFALHMPPLGQSIAWVGAAFILNIFLQSIIRLSINILEIDIPGFSMQQSHIGMFGDGAIGTVLLIVVALIIAPLVEELLFRGVILQALLTRLSAFWAISITGVAFAALHFEFMTFFPLFILGCVISWLFVRTRSLLLVAIFHLGNNLLALIAEYVMHEYSVSLALYGLQIVAF